MSWGGIVGVGRGDGVLRWEIWGWALGVEDGCRGLVLVGLG